MSKLVLELKPGEIMLINGAALRFRTRTRLELASRARFLFGKQVMEEEQAHTATGRLYHALQTAYVGPDDDRPCARAEALRRVRDEAAEAADPARRGTLAALEAAIEAGEDYAALKIARRLVVAEAGA